VAAEETNQHAQGVESSVHAPHGANHGLDEVVARTSTNESHRDVEMEDVTQDKERWWSPGHIPTRRPQKRGKSTVTIDTPYRKTHKKIIGSKPRV